MDGSMEDASKALWMDGWMDVCVPPSIKCDRSVNDFISMQTNLRGLASV